MNDGCGIKDFFRRILHALSGVKVISSITASLLIFLCIWAKHKWPHVPAKVILSGIEAIKFLCAGLLFTNAALSVFDILKGKPFNGGNSA